MKKILIGGSVAAIAAIAARQLSQHAAHASEHCTASQPEPSPCHDRSEDTQRRCVPASRGSACCSA